MRKKALSPEELQEKEIQLHFLRNFVELSSDIFCNLDKNGYCLYINEGFEKITGYSQEDIIGTHFKNYVHPADFEKSFTTFQLRVAGGNAGNLLNRLITKTGKEVYVEWAGKNDENESVFLVGRDVTDKINDQKEIVEKNNLFNSISRALPVVIYIQNLREQKLEFVSDYIETISGYTSAELFTKNNHQLSGLVPEEDLKAISASIRNFYRDPSLEITTNNFRIRHKNGVYRRVSSKETVYKRDAKGNVTHILGSLVDITEQYNAERYKDAIVRLQNLQQKRTQKIRSLSLLQGQEEERKRLARELHDGIGQLLTAIRIKLNDIEGNVAGNKSLEKSLDEVKGIVLKTIKEARNVSVALVPIDLYDFGLDPSLKHLCETAGQGSPMSIYYNSNLQNFRLNPTIEIELFRIVQESLNNSLKYSEAKSIDVTISFSEKNGALKVLIIDDGVGFDFDPDYIYKKNKKRSYGLRNMHERALIINGKLNIISRKGQGCVISVEVPLKLNEL